MDKLGLVRKARYSGKPPTIYGVKRLLDKSISGNNAEKLLGFFTLLTAYVPGREQFLLFQGSTSVGKTFILMSTAELLPPEDIAIMSSASDTAMWYDDEIRDCRIIIASEIQKHNEKTVEIIKGIHSRDEGTMQRAVTVDYGRGVDHQMIDPKVIALTFAGEWFDEQLSTRCITANLAEDWKTNKEVVEFLMRQVETPHKYKAGGYEIGNIREHIRNMPQECDVIIPFMYSFSNNVDFRYVRIRSDISKHFSLIASSAVFHYRNRLRTEIDGKDTIFATPEDAYQIYAASGELLSKTTSQLDDIQEMLMDIVNDKGTVTITEATEALRDYGINKKRKGVERKLEKLVDQGILGVEKDKGIKHYIYIKSLAENIEKVNWRKVFEYCEKRMSKEYPDQYKKYMKTVKTETINPLDGSTVDILKQTTYLVPPKILQEKKETEEIKSKGTIDNYVTQDGIGYNDFGEDTMLGKDDY